MVQAVEAVRVVFAQARALLSPQEQPIRLLLDQAVLVPLEQLVETVAILFFPR